MQVQKNLASQKKLLKKKTDITHLYGNFSYS